MSPFQPPHPDASLPLMHAAAQVWLSESTPGKDWISGTFYAKRKVFHRRHPQAHDDALARRLWDRSEQLLDTVATASRSV